MTETRETSSALPPAVRPRDAPDARVESLGDLLRYLYDRRVQIAVWFALLSAVGAAMFGAWWLAGPRNARAVVAFGFRGIEKHTYPNGRHFSIQELRAPEVLANAIERSGLAGQGAPTLVELQGGVDVVPIVPATILQQWRVQDRDGKPRGEFLPSEFVVDVHAKGLDGAQRVRFLYALMDSYRQHAKSEQLAAAHRIAAFSGKPMSDVVATNGLWDVPGLLRSYARNLQEHLEMLIDESRADREPTFHFRFRQIEEAVRTWETTRLEALTASVYRNIPVDDVDLMAKRLEERIMSLDTELRRVRDEASETERLLQIVDRPRSMVAADAGNRSDTPLVDVAALEKLVRSDYVGPVVQRVAKLNEEAARLLGRRLRAERELALFQQRVPSDLQAGASLVPLADSVAHDLTRIAEEYARALEEYLDASISGLVTVREGVYLRLPGPRPALLVLGILVCAGIGATTIVLLRDTLWMR